MEKLELISNYHGVPACVEVIPDSSKAGRPLWHARSSKYTEEQIDSHTLFLMTLLLFWVVVVSCDLFHGGYVLFRFSLTTTNTLVSSIYNKNLTLIIIINTRTHIHLLTFEILLQKRILSCLVLGSDSFESPIHPKCRSCWIYFKNWFSLWAVKHS